MLSMELQTRKLAYREFVDNVIAPVAEFHDKYERLTPESIRSVSQQGYLGSMISQTYGGLDLDMMSIGLLNEEFGRGCSSVRSLLTVHGMVSLALQRWGTPEQKANWLPRLAMGTTIGAFALSEPSAGSDARSITTTAKASGNSYILNGMKKWITMGQIADLFLVFSTVENDHTAILVERSTPGLEIVPITGLLGVRGSMAAELHFKNCIVPKENIIGRVGAGLSHVALFSLDYGRYTIAWGCVGLAQACLEESVKYAKARKQFGSPIGQHQLVQKMLTEIAVETKAARLLCMDAAKLKENGDPDSIMETWKAKYYASKIVNRVASNAVQIHGATGYHHASPVERYFRDAKLNEIIEGTSQMHEITIGMHVLDVH